MTFSVLVATRNRPDDLVPCMQSLLELDYTDYEIVVVDQSDTDASEKAVREAFGAPANLRYILTDTVGKSVALNLLIAAACGDILAFTDDDTIAPKDWLTNIERAFEEVPQADVLFGQVFAGPSNTGERACVPSFHFDKRRFLGRREISGMGANMAMKRTSPARACRFDTLLGPGAPLHASEEGDFIYRAQRAGARVLHEPTVKLIHRAFRTPEQWLGILACYGMGDAAFALKHLRCGDLRMIPWIIARYGHFASRLAYRKLKRRPHEEEHYLRGFREGIRMGMSYPVDRRTRLYVAPEKS